MRQEGYVNGAVVALIVAVLLLVGTLAFGGWAFSSRQDYKNNSDQKSADAAAAAVKDAELADAAKYAEEAKSPLKTFKGPEAFGAVTVQYPKTWSAYVVQQDTSSTPLNVYFHPDTVPDVADNDSTYSLRIRIEQRAYDTVVTSFKSQIATGKVVSAAYSLPKVPSVVGVRLDGQITPQKQGSMIILPLRNLTLEIWTESSEYLNDFNNIILPNLTFSP